VKVFDDVVSVAPGMDGRYGQAPIIPMVVKPLGQLCFDPLLGGFSPNCVDNNIKALMASNQHIIPKVTAPLIVSIHSFHFRILLKLT
jgi:hypothetical protein